MTRKIKRRAKTQSAVNSIKRGIKERKEKQPIEFIGSGSTTLNLALSGKGRNGGWPRGRVSNIVGDGSSGKTLLALEAAFWTFKNLKKIKSQVFGKVKKLHICFDNIEGVMDFPLEKMYGREFVNAVEWIRSKHFEAMCRSFLKKAKGLKKHEALLYIVDTWDAFQSRKSKEEFLKSIEDDQELKGDYDLAVQKYASRKFFPVVCDVMEENKLDATLIIISQVRDKIGITFGKKQYRAGGKALNFYSHIVPWIAEKERMSKTKRGYRRVYGIKVIVKVERSKVAKPFREAEFVILYDYGLDDIDGMIEFLWGKKKIKFQNETFKNKRSFIKYIEKNNLEDELKKLTEDKWGEIEGAFEDEVKKRKPRF